jgi:hypothetical protein
MNTSTYANGVMVEQTIDNGDGTGTRTTYDPETGQPTGSEQVTGLPIPEPAPPPLDEQVAELVATVATLLSIIEGT